MSLETVDFERLSLQPGMRILDLGCGEGRHALSAWLRAPVIAVGLDLSASDLCVARQRQAELPRPDSSEGAIGFVQGSALQLPFADASFDVVICSEVLEHLFDYQGAIDEVARVLRPGGTFIASVPRYWPERICWLLSDTYHEAPGGHIRIFRRRQLEHAVSRRGFRRVAHHGAHALHVPYWWLRCAAGSEAAAERSTLVRLWHRLLVWDLMSAPRLTRTLERWLAPVLGKSVVCYFRREVESA